MMRWRWVIAASCALLLAGCEQTVSNVRVQPPAATPAPQTALVNVGEGLPVSELPLTALPTTSLRLDTRAAIDILVDQVRRTWLPANRNSRPGMPRGDAPIWTMR